MPTFIDRHSLAAIPSALQRQMQKEALNGIVNSHGVQPVAHWVTDGVIYRVVHAPSVEALCNHHAERGLVCNDLRPIAGLRESHPLSAEETQLGAESGLALSYGHGAASRAGSGKAEGVGPPDGFGAVDGAAVVWAAVERGTGCTRAGGVCYGDAARDRDGRRGRSGRPGRSGRRGRRRRPAASRDGWRRGSPPGGRPRRPGARRHGGRCRQPSRYSHAHAPAAC
jgi:(2Fe-2S) ferredoxin